MEDIQRIDAIVDGFRLMDDDFFNVVLDHNTETCTFIIRKVLKRQDIIVTDVKTQSMIHNLSGRTIILDALAHDASGKTYNIEIQKDKRGANPFRARYYASMLDASTEVKDRYYRDLTENYVIFLNVSDILKTGHVINFIEHYIEGEDMTKFNDGQHIIYVNAENSDGSEISDLMHDFMVRDADDMYNPFLRDLMKRFKEFPKERQKVCEEVKKYGDEREEEGINIGIAQGIDIGKAQGIDIGKEQGIDIGKVQGIETVVKSILGNGTSIEETSRLTNIPLETVKAIYYQSFAS